MKNVVVVVVVGQREFPESAWGWLVKSEGLLRGIDSTSKRGREA